MKVAALDLGTNTFLCLIAEGNSAGELTKVHQDLMEIVRLGQDIDKTHRIDPQALMRAKECLTRFKKEIDSIGVDKVLAMATSAARDADNGHELFAIGDDLGIPIRVIPGEDEARITFQGALIGQKSHEGLTLVVDVGGGSTEYILGNKEELKFAKSLDIGGVRLTERFITRQPIPDDQKINLQKFIQENLIQELADLKSQKIGSVVAVAGTPTSIAAIELGGFVEKKVDGYFLSKKSLQHWCQEFASTSVEEKKMKYGLGGRADIIYAGASILLETLAFLNIDGLTVSTKGVRYGVALEMLKA